MPRSSTSTRATAVHLLAYFIAGLRLATLVQMLPSLAAAMTATDHRLLTAATWVLAASSLVALAVVALVRRRPHGAPLAGVDVAVALALLAAGWWTVPVEMRMGTWVGFQLGLTLCVACSLTGVRSRWVWLPLLLALSVAEGAYLSPTVASWADLPHLLGNVLTVLVIGPMAWFGARMVVRLGEEADQARRYAAEAAQAEEERRARMAIHNGAALMRLLVETGADSDSEAHRNLRSQAGVELNRMRAYLVGERPPSAGGPTTLAALVTAAGAEFDDLPITVITDLAQGITLDRQLADSLVGALRSLLLNVREHAACDRVVLHAAELPEGPGWEVTLHDNGVGYDTATTTYGVGLREVVVEQLARSGVATDIASTPGLGTTVTLTGGSDSVAGEAGDPAVRTSEATR